MEWLAAVVFALAAAFLFWALAGYPLFLAAAGRHQRKTPAAGSVRRSVSIIVPVRNGERWIAAKLDSILALRYPRDLVEILVISDGSEDGTERIAAGYGSRGVELIRTEAVGKAAALNRGMERARGEIFFFTDVRQPLDPDCLSCLVDCFADPEVGAATGELILLPGESSAEADLGFYWRYEKWIRRQLQKTGSLLVVTGCVFAIRRELARPLPVDTLIDDAVLPIEVLLAGYRIVFAENAKAFDYPAELKVEFSRKTRTLAGLFQLVRMHPVLLNPFHRLGFHFLSYKFSRLLLPYALIAALAASFALPRPWRWWIVAAQGLFYAMAAADPLIPERSRSKRLFSLPHTFLTLMVAALSAVCVFFLPAGRLWKPTETRPPNAARPGRR